ncbi:pectin lyase fold/virulence factor [Rhizoctonia solani]|nr:pectin lyase fold/virulence factor [Rhizoctonia solani]
MPSPSISQAILLLSALSGLSQAATCIVKSAGNANISDVPAIETAFASCGNGGIIQFPAGQTYAINKLLKIQGCNGCEVQLDGTLKLKADISLWNQQAQPFAFQASHLAIIVDGANNMKFHSPTGKGLIDGSGQIWYDQSPSIRPILWTTANSTGVTYDRIKMIDSPMWFNLVTDSSHITFTNTIINATSSSSKPAHNTDGFDTYRSSHVTIQGLWYNGGDDSISFKPNSTDVTVKDAVVLGSHGVSVGSISQYPGVYDIIENIYVQNVTFGNGLDGTKSQNGIRIKSFPGGYGSGMIKNVTYQDIVVKDVTHPIVIDSCYMEKAAYCSSHPAQTNITDVHINNVSGTSSGSTVVSLSCTPKAACYVYMKDIKITPPKGSPKYICTNLSDPNDVGIPCTSS